jgi:hypothetical protein
LYYGNEFEKYFEISENNEAILKMEIVTANHMNPHFTYEKSRNVTLSEQCQTVGLS